MENKKEILMKIQPIFQEVFNNKKLKINYDSSPETINKWDSLSQINLIVCIEKLLKVKFNVSELGTLHNVGNIIDLIIKKKNYEKL